MMAGVSRNKHVKFILLIALLMVIWRVLWRRGGSRLLDLAIALLPMALVWEIVGRFAGVRSQWVAAGVVLTGALYVAWRRRKSRIERQ